MLGARWHPARDADATILCIRVQCIADLILDVPQCGLPGTNNRTGTRCCLPKAGLYTSQQRCFLNPIQRSGLELGLCSFVRVSDPPRLTIEMSKPGELGTLAQEHSKPKPLECSNASQADGARGPATPSTLDNAVLPLETPGAKSKGPAALGLANGKTAAVSASSATGPYQPGPAQQAEKDMDLEDIIRDSPFLDLSSPMTAYEWFKLVVMVRALDCHVAGINIIIDSTSEVVAEPTMSMHAATGVHACSHWLPRLAHACRLQVPAVLVRLAITVTCLPMVWAVVRLIMLGVAMNEPVEGWRRALMVPFLKFWARVLLHIGFNLWPSVKGPRPLPCNIVAPFTQQLLALN